MLKISQKVICIKQHSKGILNVGAIYTILDIIMCDKCKTIGIDVGIHDECSGVADCRCGNHIIHKVNIWYVAAELFRPIEYDIISNKDIIKDIIIEKSDIPIKKEIEVI